MLMCCLSALHTGLGDGRAIFLSVLRIVVTLKIIIIFAHSLSRVHTQDLLPLTGKKIFFVLRMITMPFQYTVFCCQWKVPPPQPHKLKSSLLQLQSSHSNTLPFSSSLASPLIWLLLRTIKLLTSPSRWPGVAVPAVPTSWPWHHSTAFKPPKS